MRIPRRRLSLIAVAAFFCGAILDSNAAGQMANRAEVRTLSLGIVSEMNQKEIEAYYRDFMFYVARKLSSALEVEGKVIVASTPSELAKLLGQQKVDFYMESAYSTYVINDVQGAGKLLLRRWQRGKPEYQSLIFTKRNGGINRLDDLRGKIVVFEDPESTSGYFLPKFFLLRNGFKLSEKGGLDASVAAGRNWLCLCLFSAEARRLGSDRAGGRWSFQRRRLCQARREGKSGRRRSGAVGKVAAPPRFHPKRYGSGAGRSPQGDLTGDV